jgi:hypothetical protein
MGKVFWQQRGLDVQLIELRDRAALPGRLGSARRKQRKHGVEHRVVRAVDRRPMEPVGQIEHGRSERLVGLLQPVPDQRMDLLGVGHAATPSRRMLATSVLADIGPRSKSSAVRITRATSRPCSKPSSQAER